MACGVIAVFPDDSGSLLALNATIAAARAGTIDLEP